MISGVESLMNSPLDISVAMIMIRLRLGNVIDIRSSPEARRSSISLLDNYALLNFTPISLAERRDA